MITDHWEARFRALALLIVICATVAMVGAAEIFLSQIDAALILEAVKAAS